MKTRLLTCVVLVVALLPDIPAQAGAMTKVVSEAFEYVASKFGRQVAAEGAERVSARLTRLAAQHGDEVVATAFRKVGPQAGRLAEEAGERGGLALGLLARHGEEAIPLIARSTALAKVARYGDSAAVAIMKHGTVGEQVISQFGKEGAEALARVAPQNGRRLAMLAAAGRMKPELMQVVTRYGDEACSFLWKNKFAIGGAAVVTAFVANPQPFLDGTQKLAETVAGAAVKPLAMGVANNTNWTVIGVMVTAILAITGYLWAGMTGKFSWWRDPSAKPTSRTNASRN